MRRLRSNYRRPSRCRRAGFSYQGLTVALVVLAVVALVAWQVWPESFSAQGGGGPMTHEVTIKKFVHDVTERGNVESASNTEISSKVKSGKSGMSGTTILEVVDEGIVIKPEDCLPEEYEVTYEDLVRLEEYLESQASEEKETDTAKTGQKKTGFVVHKIVSRVLFNQFCRVLKTDVWRALYDAYNRPVRTWIASRMGGKTSDGEKSKTKPKASAPPPIPPEKLAKCMVLVRFDCSSLEEELLQQQITCENSSAMVIQAENNLETAIISKKEYIEGTYEQEHLDLEIKIDEAEVAWRQAEKYLEYSEKLYRKGYVTKQQRKDSETDLDKAKNALELAKKRLLVLEKYTRKKEEGQLAATIKTAEAKLRADKASNRLDVQKLEFLQEQIAHCTIFAPRPGQVVYANTQGHRGSGEIVIEAGTSIRENQAIIRLPDRSQMQVTARINESRIAMIETGMSVTVRLDAFPDLELHGAVEEIGAYPAPAHWLRADVKEYETIIKIHDPPPDLRPGLTAEVKIRARQIAKAMQVPVQTIIEHGAKYYCVMYDKNTKDFKKREVTIGPTNDKFVVIETGLDVGQKVVLNAGAYRDKIGLPKQLSKTERQSEGSSERARPPGKTGDWQSSGGKKTKPGGPKRPGARPGGKPSPSGPSGSGS
ncbi:MAG: HlyD family efflux transporter periplasmic adaptor subunit [Candidatus Nealsonbacteria bacterium]|nr:HlyD family efflux transporter periplasmic adaptor subunit [Candidatus Nealsonbacteria bacterium]